MTSLKSTFKAVLPSPSFMLLLPFFAATVSCKQRSMNETAAPDSIGATYDGKENFIWPLIKEPVTNTGQPSKEVCWYTYQKDQSGGSAQSGEVQYSPEQIREFFLKANAVGGAAARYVPLAAFKNEAQGAAQANDLKFWGTIASCNSGAVLALRSLLTNNSNRYLNAAAAITNIFCLGGIGRMLLKNPRNDDTAQDAKISSNFSSLSANSFLTDARIPPLEHKALLKTIEKTIAANLKQASEKAGETCPTATKALEQVDATMRALYNAQSAPSTTP